MRRILHGPAIGATLLTTAVLGAGLVGLSGPAYADGTSPIVDIPACEQTDFGPADDEATGLQDLSSPLTAGGVTFDRLQIANNGELFLYGDDGGLTIETLDFDVDTRGEGSGTMTWGQGTFEGHEAWCATFPDVGYFPGQTDELNDFQVLLVDRSDVGPGDFDVVLNYAAIERETGSIPVSITRVSYRGGGETTLFSLPDYAADWGRLVTTSRDSGVTGRHVVRFRDGEVATPRQPDVVTFVEGSPTTGVVGGSFVPRATAGSDGPVELSIDPQSGDVCSMPNAAGDDVLRQADPSDDRYRVDFDAAGTCLVNATRPGDDSFLPGSAQLSIAVRRPSSGGGTTPTPTATPTTTSVVTTSRSMTATVTSSDASPTSTPAGSVTFTVDGVPVGSAALSPVSGQLGAATATLRERVATDGSHTVGAAYAGTTSWTASTGSYVRTNPGIAARVVSSRGPNASGWYRTPVTVRFTCSAGSADLTSACPGPVSRRNTDPGKQFTGTVTAVDGGVGSTSVPVQVDTAGPELAISRRGEAPWTPGARPIRCTAVDGRSGLLDDCTVTYGELVEGPQGGTRRTWTATATDVAGNTTTRRGSFRVA